VFATSVPGASNRSQVVQSSHGISAGGASGGQQARQGRRDADHADHGGDDQRVGGPHAMELALEHTADGQDADEASALPAATITSPSRSTSRTMAAVFPPRAIRIPISRRRCATW